MLELESSRWTKPVALLVCVAMTGPLALAGCGGGGNTQTATAPPPPGMNSRRPRMAQPATRPKAGMSTGKKVAILAGAAALYYIYNKRKNKPKAEAGPEGKYFISKSTGRVYYRNLKTGSFQWVSPPRTPIRVPAAQASQYQNYAGYNNKNDGQTFGGYGPGQETYNDAEPAAWNGQN